MIPTCMTSRAPRAEAVQILSGRSVTIRALQPQDGGLLRRFFQNLSPESRYARFMTHWRDVPQPLIDRLSDVDWRRHFALVATTLAEGAYEYFVGEVRGVVTIDNVQQCEFALAVADPWQRLGLGSALLEHLETLVVHKGVEVIKGEALTSNIAMHRTARRAGYKLTLGSGQMHLEKRLASKG